jgi:hypothetical protein
LEEMWSQSRDTWKRIALAVDKMHWEGQETEDVTVV